MLKKPEKALLFPEPASSKEIIGKEIAVIVQQSLLRHVQKTLMISSWIPDLLLSVLTASDDLHCLLNQSVKTALRFLILRENGHFKR